MIESIAATKAGIFIHTVTAPSPIFAVTGYEHGDALFDGTIESITAAKAGIMKRGRPVVVASTLTLILPISVLIHRL